MGFIIILYTFYLGICECVCVCVCVCVWEREINREKQSREYIESVNYLM